MGTFTFTSLHSFAVAVDRDMRARDRRLQSAIKKTARETRNYVMRTVPKAFGELAESTHEVDVAPGYSEVIVDAPHAAAVENGSRPHWVPLAALIAWVNLRGIQGLTSGGRIRKVTDPRMAPARLIASSLHDRLGRKAAADWRANAQARMTAAGGPAEDADPATLAVARAIQLKIAKEGTRPHAYMQDSVEPARDFLDGFVREALPDP